MNSKQLVVEFKNGAHAGTLFVELDKDAEDLIRARNAQVPAARRSCYLEQDQKWRSAVSKSNVEGIDVDGYKNHCMNDQKLKWVFVEPVQERAVRDTMQGTAQTMPPLTTLAMLGFFAREAVAERDLKNQETCSRYLESYNRFRKELKETHSKMAATEEDLCASSATCSMMELIHVTIGLVKDFTYYTEYWDLLDTVYQMAREREPSLPARYGQWIQALILRFHAPEMKTALGVDKYEELLAQYKHIEL